MRRGEPNWVTGKKCSLVRGRMDERARLGIYTTTRYVRQGERGGRKKGLPTESKDLFLRRGEVFSLPSPLRRVCIQECILCIVTTLFSPPPM